MTLWNLVLDRMDHRIPNHHLQLLQCLCLHLFWSNNRACLVYLFHRVQRHMHWMLYFQSRTLFCSNYRFCFEGWKERHRLLQLQGQKWWSKLISSLLPLRMSLQKKKITSNECSTGDETIILGLQIILDHSSSSEFIFSSWEYVPVLLESFFALLGDGEQKVYWIGVGWSEHMMES